MSLVIGLSGFVSSGKTTISDLFVQGYGFKRLSFADPIRQMMMALGVSEQTLRDTVAKEQPHPALCGQTPRHAMETLGTAWGRDMIHPDIWKNQFVVRAQSKPLVICDDVRYQNEVDTITHMGGRVYRLVVPGREPRVKTDVAAQNLTGVEDVINDIGTTKITDIFGYIYGKSFDLHGHASFEDYLTAVG